MDENGVKQDLRFNHSGGTLRWWQHRIYPRCFSWREKRIKNTARHERSLMELPFVTGCLILIKQLQLRCKTSAAELSRALAITPLTELRKSCEVDFSDTSHTSTPNVRNRVSQDLGCQRGLLLIQIYGRFSIYNP